jgi:hypothetical protein
LLGRSGRLAERETAGLDPRRHINAEIIKLFERLPLETALDR